MVLLRKSAYGACGILMKDSIEIVNLVPRFLNLYNKAVGFDEETRFELWKEHYGFAAVPPEEEGALLENFIF